MTLSKDEPVLSPSAGEAVRFQGLGARFMLDAAITGGGFSLIEHPIDPKSLAGPLHTHKNEDEYSYIIEGEVGMQVGDKVITARPGDLVFKPRHVQHAFWNATDKRARVLEIISPAGFERYFAELAPLLNREGPPDQAAMGALVARYELIMDFESIPRIIERYGLTRP